jgi:riboflavin kinase/FMN adenylyltransferase
MRVLASAGEVRANGRPVYAAIGTFDGVHRGHQEVVGAAAAAARRVAGLSLAITFDRHPSAVVSPQRTPPMIYTMGQKLAALAATGVEATVVIPFDIPFSRQTGEDFIRALARTLGSLAGLCIGRDFVFGHRRSGNLALLQTLGAELGFQVQGVAPVMLDGEVVSSTRIRRSILEGDLEAASRSLGRRYAIRGGVERGDQVGRRIGFPTANLATPGLALPPNGVYAGWAPHGQRLAVINVGCRPTLLREPGTPRVEVHLLDFEGDLYGAELEVELHRRLRAEQRFPSMEALRDQIARDARAAREILSAEGRP